NNDPAIEQIQVFLHIILNRITKSLIEIHCMLDVVSMGHSVSIPDLRAPTVPLGQFAGFPVFIDSPVPDERDDLWSFRQALGGSENPGKHAVPRLPGSIPFKYEIRVITHIFTIHL